eukprot:gnl/MRDRNA2_/MRDRNA2_81167_c0_seq3.p2 gnl/MRDRNA2_/MRDRNA2_81167_c0~~gnl/MRDRNA2_/MRDRNA2_81167_c0_seq3.p2  ORF type:complete len:278 (-),score=58.05 gnl/MRDRNA2_/MRDRNA2_81167_c0_seq3:84-917(-)
MLKRVTGKKSLARKEYRKYAKMEHPSTEEEIDHDAEAHALSVLEDMQQKMAIASKFKRRRTAVDPKSKNQPSKLLASLSCCSWCSAAENIEYPTPYIDVHEDLEEESPPGTPRVPRLILKFELDRNIVRKVFDEYDFYGIGQIDIRFMAQALGPHGLGFDVPRPVLRQLLKKYDEDDNRSYDFKEFKALVQDPQLQGRYIGDRRKTEKEVDSSIVKVVRSLGAVFRKGVHRSVLLNRLSVTSSGHQSQKEPLLAVRKEKKGSSQCEDSEEDDWEYIS